MDEAENTLSEYYLHKTETPSFTSTSGVSLWEGTANKKDSCSCYYIIYGFYVEAAWQWKRKPPMPSMIYFSSHVLFLQSSALWKQYVSACKR